MEIGVCIFDSSACVRVKEVESERFRVDIGVTGLHHIPFAFQCIYGCSDERGENVDGKERNEIFGGGEIMEIAWLFVCG